MKFSTLYAIISLASLAVAVAIATPQENEALDGESNDWNCMRCRWAFITKQDMCHSSHCVSRIVLVDLKFRVS